MKSSLKRVFITVLLFILFFQYTTAQVRIKLNKEGGVYTTFCKVNGLQLKFIFDTGASNVSLSSVEAVFMLKNGYLSKDDIKGSTYNQLANGEIIKNTTVTLRDVEIAGITIHNVKATIIDNIKAPLLLGESFIQRLGRIELNGNILTIYNQKTGKTLVENMRNAYLLTFDAEGYYDNKLYTLAFNTYQKAYDLYPGALDDMHLFRMGSSYYRTGHYNLAIKYLKLAIKKNENKKAPFKLRLLYNNLEKTKKIPEIKLGTFEQFKQTMKDSLKAHTFYKELITKYNFTTSYIRTWKYFSEYVADYFSELDTYNDDRSYIHVFANFDIGDSYKELKQYDDAILYYEKVISAEGIYSMNDFASEGIASAYFEQKKYNNAIYFYKRAIDYYIKRKSITNEKIISGKIDDGFLGELFWNIFACYRRLDEPEEANPYLIKSALCGNADAKRACDHLGINYNIYRK